MSASATGNRPTADGYLWDRFSWCVCVPTPSMLRLGPGPGVARCVPGMLQDIRRARLCPEL
ncbi:MAG: hypothetical protein ACPIOQ_83720, partial [Promethearchaeia archaeon]